MSRRGIKSSTLSRSPATRLREHPLRRRASAKSLLHVSLLNALSQYSAALIPATPIPTTAPKLTSILDVPSTRLCFHHRYATWNYHSLEWYTAKWNVFRGIYCSCPAILSRTVYLETRDKLWIYAINRIPNPPLDRSCKIFSLRRIRIN